MKYAIVEILGRQYKVEPGKELLVDRLKASGKFECDKVLLLAEEGNISLGNPYLKEKLTFEVLEEIKGDKIRVAKFHAKANYRKVKGARALQTKIKLSETKSEKKSVKK